uniref:apiosidase-like domain-containing protein n=1 Tax=Salmonella sp. SAL4444 TaxID=3159899 RepID=UPI00397BD394
SMRGALKDFSLLDFDMIQTPHGQMEAVGPSVEAVRFSHREKPALPTINAEPSYEMLMDKTPAEVCRRIFWVCWASGVKGYTYGANGI